MGVGGDGTGRFELNPDALMVCLAKWRGVREDLLADQAHGTKLLKTKPAGDEPASKTMANLVRRSGEEFLRHNKALVDYVDGHIAALAAAYETYVNGEESAVRAMRRLTR